MSRLPTLGTLAAFAWLAVTIAALGALSEACRSGRVGTADA